VHRTITTSQATEHADALEIARRYWASGGEVRDRTAAECLESVVQAAHAVAAALRQGGKLLICGNGGSAADSQHLAGEFVSVLDRQFQRPALAAIALTTDSSILTAIANDFGYDRIFERQVEALGRPGDVLLGISTSGNSENILRAVELARKTQITTIALSGHSGGRLSDGADISICIPSESVQHTQEMHLTVEHLLTSLVEQELFGDQSNER
jgi:D-sedoheptulose 7-phosphate isomerase